MKEYVAIVIVIIFLVVLSETRIKIGVDKFSQIACAGHLKEQYESLNLLMRENPDAFAANPDQPWYTLLPDINPDQLTCPSASNGQPDSKDAPMACDYAIDAQRYNTFKSEKMFEVTKPRQILLLDCEQDPTRFNIFPMVNPAFRHSDGCNILLMEGTVVWCDKADFAGDDFSY